MGLILMLVKEIKREDTLPFLLKKHYAKRIPSVSYAYGLYVEGKLEGVVTYGTPASSSLRRGLCGPDNIHLVLELNRLCLNDGLPKNSASLLVARSLKLLPHPKVIVSYADTGAGHVGYIYQATNFLYTGLSAKVSDYMIKGMEHLHGQTIMDKYRGTPNRVKVMKEIYGDKLIKVPRTRKHRYVYFVGCNSGIRKSLRYKVEPYPKGETHRHNEDVRIEV